MRIVTIIESLDVLNGRGRAHYRICSSLAARGHEVVVHARDVTTGEQEWSAFAEVELWPPGSWAKVLRTQPLSTAKGFLALTGQLSRSRPDVLYVPQRLLHATGAVASLRSSAPLVCHLHDPPKEWDRQDRLANRRVVNKIAVSRAQAEAWRESGMNGSYTVVYNGIDCDRFHPPSEAERSRARASLGLTDADLVVGFAGRMHPDKGVHVLIEAFRSLSECVEDARLVLAGAGLDEVYLERLRQLGDGLPVTWPGLVDRVELVYWAADVMALPSTGHDSFPLGSLEAMACGVPAVVSRIGGLPEGVPMAHDDLVVAPGDVDQLAATMARCLSWRSEAPRLGGDLCEHVRKEFSEAEMIDAIEAALRQATDQ